MEYAPVLLHVCTVHIVCALCSFHCCVSFVLSTCTLVVEGVSESSTRTKLMFFFFTKDVCYDCLNSGSGGFL